MSEADSNEDPMKKLIDAIPAFDIKFASLSSDKITLVMLSMDS